MWAGCQTAPCCSVTMCEPVFDSSSLRVAKWELVACNRDTKLAPYALLSGAKLSHCLFIHEFLPLRGPPIRVKGGMHCSPLHGSTHAADPCMQADAKASVDTLEAVTSLALQGCKAAAGAMREALLQHVQSLAVRRGAV